MIIKIATCLLALSCVTACTTTTTTTAGRETLERRMLAANTPNPNEVVEPMPPAEGPEDIPADGNIDPVRNPGLVPTPLLRQNAASGL